MGAFGSHVSDTSDVLTGNGASVDEETFQRVMGELKDMKTLLGSLMRQLQIQQTIPGSPSLPGSVVSMSSSTSTVAAAVDSPREELSRSQLFRLFNLGSNLDPKLFQDASTQTCTDAPSNS